ncbi:MAG: hypothetical protein AAGJ97_11665 [Planctomycetota bacterium]
MLPLAEACDFRAGSFGDAYGGRLHRWDEDERFELKAQLDAAYFHLYGLDRDDVEYVLSTFKAADEPGPGGTTVKSRIIQLFSEYAFPQ